MPACYPGRIARLNRSTDVELQFAALARTVVSQIARVRESNALLEAYDQDGWRGANREKIKPTAELQRARQRILDAKVKIRSLLVGTDVTGLTCALSPCSCGSGTACASSTRRAATRASRRSTSTRLASATRSTCVEERFQNWQQLTLPRTRSSALPAETQSPTTPTTSCCATGSVVGLTTFRAFVRR